MEVENNGDIQNSMVSDGTDTLRKVTLCSGEIDFDNEESYDNETFLQELPALPNVLISFHTLHQLVKQMKNKQQQLQISEGFTCTEG